MAGGFVISMESSQMIKYGRRWCFYELKLDRREWFRWSALISNKRLIRKLCENTSKKNERKLGFIYFFINLQDLNPFSNNEFSHKKLATCNPGNLNDFCRVAELSIWHFSFFNKQNKIVSRSSKHVWINHFTKKKFSKKLTTLLFIR